MRVTILLFARLRDIVGSGELERDVAAGSTPRDVWRVLEGEHPELAGYANVISCAVNEEYARLTTTLAHGDEVAFLPPVSGGAGRRTPHHHDSGSGFGTVHV